ncbi:MAG: hypothetical protein IPK44_01750 [Candidatus Accumulibacter sp.]|uniref:hypothetical protein n=1 Tax=Accumulibacter sp. TaxID=2053492 RepID=UPI0025898F25|nr:hypothetical protein [Accumulibacter sp.]MBK8113324.1 hypothetical protein [Accumulibacter sp.]
MGNPKPTTQPRFKPQYKPLPAEAMSYAEEPTNPQAKGMYQLLKPKMPDQNQGRFKSLTPKWLDVSRAKIDITDGGQLYIRPHQDQRAYIEADRITSKLAPMYKPMFDEQGGMLIDAKPGVDYDVEYAAGENGAQQRKITLYPRETKPEPLAIGQPGEQQFGLAPGDPETTLRGGLARFMGNPVVKIAETGLGGTLPGAMVGSAILPGIGTVIGAGVGTGLSLLAGQQQFDENNVAARGLAVLGGAAIGQTLIPVPILGAIIGGAAGLLMGPQVLDAAREGLERGVGFAEQTVGAIVDPAKYGWQSTTLDGRLREMGQAWDAARNTYESSTLDVRALSPEGWGKYDLFGREDAVFVDWDLPATTGGLTALVEARRRMAAGEDAATVQAEMAARYGAPGQMRELASGFVLDPLNVAGDVQKVGLKGFAQVTGDTVLRDAIEGAGKKGGMVDVMQQYKQLLTNEVQFRSGFDAAQDMNRLQRLIIGEDVIKLAQGQPYQEPRWWELWKLTPDSAAKDRVVQADNFVQAYLSALPTDDTFGDRALRVLTNLKDGPQYGPAEAGMDEVLRASQTIEGRVVRQHLDVSAARDTVQAWQDTADLRGELVALADGAGTTPGELVKRIKAVADDEGLVGLVNELRATPSLTSPARGNAAAGEGLTVEKLKTLGKVFGDGAVPFTPEHLKAAMIAGQIEASAKWAVNTFGIKPPPFMERVAAAVKAVQSTVLLGLNPSYVVNNIINGEVTMAARGVWGLRGLVEARDELARAGIEPSRLASGGTIGDLDVSFNPGEMLGAAQAEGMRTIAAAQSYEGTLADIKRAGQTLSEHAPMTRLSPKIEKWQSLRAFYEGWKQHMGTNWRPGRSMPKLDPTLESQLARIDSRLPGQLYAAAEAGLNPAEIYGAIFAERPTVRVQAHVGAVAARLGMAEDDVARALAVDGLAGTLNEELAKAGTNPGKIDRAFDTVRNKAEEMRTQAHAEEVQTHAAYAAEAARLGDPGEMLSLMDDVEMRLYESHQAQMRAEAEHWARIKDIKSSQLKQALQMADRERAAKHWGTWFDYEAAVTGAMDDGLKQGGLQLDDGFSVAAKMKRAAAQRFIDERNRLHDEFFAAKQADAKWAELHQVHDKVFDADARWAEVQAAKQAAYERMTQETTQIQERVDRYIAAEFGRRYDAKTGEAVAAWRNHVRELKQQDMQAVSAHTKRLENLPQAQHDAAWREFNEARLKRLHVIEQESISLRRKAQEAMWNSGRTQEARGTTGGMNNEPPPQPSPAGAGEGSKTLTPALSHRRGGAACGDCAVVAG